MKITLDYDNKKIILEQDCNIGEFMERIEHLLPDWDNWTLQTKREVSLGSPARDVTIPSPQIQPYTPWYEQPGIIWTTPPNDGTITIEGGDMGHTFTGYN